MNNLKMQISTQLSDIRGIRTPLGPDLSSPPAHSRGMGHAISSQGDIQDIVTFGHGRWSKIRPVRSSIGKFLQGACDLPGAQPAFKNQVEPAQMHGHRLIWVITAGVLYGIGIHGELVYLAKEYRVLELSPDYFCEEAPAFR
jgi:hypothetical protein